MTVQEFKAQAVKSLDSSPTAGLDVNVLLEFCLKKDRTWILMNGKTHLSSAEFSWLSDAVALRRTGLPVAYITGRREFFGYDFFVSPSVLIPKPDTEILVENAIDEIIAKIESRSEIVLSVCDMCTGSGCVGLSVLRTLIDEYSVPSGSLPKFTFCDISSDALEVAKINAKNLLPQAEFEQIRFIQTNLFSEVPYTFDVILANPPYVPSAMVDELLQDGRNEPRLALDGDLGLFGEKTESADGLELIRRLVPECAEHLIHNGVLIMEAGEYNAQETLALFEEHGFRRTKIIRDYEGQLRDVYGVK